MRDQPFRHFFKRFSTKKKKRQKGWKKGKIINKRDKSVKKPSIKQKKLKKFEKGKKIISEGNRPRARCTVLSAYRRRLLYENAPM